MLQDDGSLQNFPITFNAFMIQCILANVLISFFHISQGFDISCIPLENIKTQTIIFYSRNVEKLISHFNSLILDVINFQLIFYINTFFSISSSYTQHTSFKTLLCNLQFLYHSVISISMFLLHLLVMVKNFSLQTKRYAILQSNTVFCKNTKANFYQLVDLLMVFIFIYFYKWSGKQIIFVH